MAVFVDPCQWPFKGTLYCHMMTDGDTEELLGFAKEIGLDLKWIQYKGTYREHFDLSPAKRKQAIRKGALDVESREMWRRCAYDKGGKSER